MVALDSWQGPLRAAQDFHVDGGAIEVKSTAKAQGFIARINSIEQLNTERWPMFLCAVRFVEDEAGDTLTQRVHQLRHIMDGSGVRKQFDALLLLSRYFDEHEERYTKKMLSGDIHCYQVDDEFPCLMRSLLPGQIRSAQYDLDVEGLECGSRSMDDMFGYFGETLDDSV
jgi:hypothetical protein